MSDRIKVAGYSERLVVKDNVEYRDFSPDLVGIQMTSLARNSVFTLGNFTITTNYEPKLTKNYVTPKFSNFISLTDLNLTLEQAIELLSNNAGVYLNFDRRNLSFYCLFGSMVEYVRVSLENIISNWPASLYVNPLYTEIPSYNTFSAYTVENYTYNSITNESTFKVNTNTLNNKFKINYLSIGSYGKLQNQSNKLRDLTTSYDSYSILYNDKEYNIIEFTGSTNLLNDYIYLKVKGNVFSGTSTGDYIRYHIKPNYDNENNFFNSLDYFESYLLNRQILPKYTSKFDVVEIANSGSIIYTNKSYTWPVSDGYNIDFDTKEYEKYASQLLKLSTDYDLVKSNLMVRFLVSESISGFDTAPVRLSPLDEDTSGQKVNKTLTIYGVEYDNINRFIQGIKFANNVSYDKTNNVPDVYLKDLARVLGWDLISSVLENNLLKAYITPQKSSFSGLSVGYTLVEADYELWRRIILNTSWIWKSKGTRKSIEFLFKFIGTPLGLIKFNEYIYLAENRIDINLFNSVLALNDRPLGLFNYSISQDGYPKPKFNNENLYFQSDGLWYRETGGVNSIIDINYGNNPHIGTYDGGNRYLNQFRKLIDDFSATTIVQQTNNIVTNNLFTNYNRGTITGYSGKTFVDITTVDGSSFDDCFIVTPTIIQDPKQRKLETDCGCVLPEELQSLSICIEKRDVKIFDCSKEIAKTELVSPHNYYSFSYYQYNIDGSLFTSNGQPILHKTPFINKECCSFAGSVPYFYYQDNDSEPLKDPNVIPKVLNSGYICCSANNLCGCFVTCRWTLHPDLVYGTFDFGTQNYYLLFQAEMQDGLPDTRQSRLVSQDGCNCLRKYTDPVLMTDPFTNQVGYACKLKRDTNGNFPSNSEIEDVIKNTYLKRAAGEIACNGILP